MVCRADRISTTYRIEPARVIAALLALPLLAVQSVMAQDVAAPPRLEDLIPEQAVEDPEIWARQGVPNADGADSGGSGTGESDDIGTDVVSPDMQPMPDLALPWPQAGDFSRPQPLEPEPGLEFVEDLSEPIPALPDGEKIKVASGITLVFPGTVAQFPVRDEFVARFRELSTIKELSDGEESYAQLAVRARMDAELLGRLLRNYGYYDARTSRTVGGIAPGEDDATGDAEFRFDIIPGTQYRFGEIDLGALPQAPDYDALRAAFEIVPGDPVLADKIVEESFDLDQALGETGYPFAAISDPSLLIDHDRQEGDLTLPVQPGGKYAFGDVTSNMPEFLSGRHLQEIARFNPGDIYKRSDEMDLRRAILATGLVSSAVITPRRAKAPAPGEPGTVAMDVAITKAPLRTIAGSIGYGSGEGFRLQGSWEHRNLFPPEGALRVRGIAGTREQLAGVTFRRNNWHGRDKILTVDAFATNIERDAYDARTLSLLANYERVSTLLFQKKFSWAAGLELVASDEREGAVAGTNAPRQTFFIGALPVRAQIDTSDSLLDPARGFRISGRLSPEISMQGGKQSIYLRSQADASYYQRAGSKVVLAGRARLGSIFGTDISNIAPSRRFYAGGGGSVRGYGYQEIGPRDDLGDPSGGRSLVEFSLEARVQTGMFDGALSVVPFIDAGAVDRSAMPDFSNMQYGAGLGIRYNTGFGPIRIDVATPLNRRPGDSRIGVYVALGQAF